MQMRGWWSPGRPVSLVGRDGRLTAIRLVSPAGERTATFVRPCTLADAFQAPFVIRRPRGE